LGVDVVAAVIDFGIISDDSSTSGLSVLLLLLLLLVSTKDTLSSFFAWIDDVVDLLFFSTVFFFCGSFLPLPEAVDAVDIVFFFFLLEVSTSVEVDAWV
jgi:hypothetical protein